MIDRVINESSRRITCGYQEYQGHNGVDLGWRSDETQNNVYANSKGIVIDVKDGVGTLPLTLNSWGNYVLVEHPNGMRSRYAHLRKGTINVSVGQEVDENTIIGIIGESGSVNGRHLHFDVYKDGNRINPTEYLIKPIYEEKVIESINSTIEISNNNEFKVGDKVLLLSGRATERSDGSGNVTAEYDGNIEDIGNIKYITIINIGAVRPYHVSNDKENTKPRGWVSKGQIKKI